jgi:hypothetical protein
MSVATTTGPVPDVGRRRKQCYEAIRAFLSDDDLSSATSCALRLRAEFPDRRPLSHYVVLVAYGGGKDSSYTVTFVRFLQLIIDLLYGNTFIIRTVTNWYPGMPSAVLRNIDRTYQALGLYDDPSCELLLVDGSQVLPFRNEPRRVPEIVQRIRLDMLMTGHRTGGDARPTFCNACNFSMINAFGLAARHGQDVDMIITGDSSDERSAYIRWVAGAARRIGAAKPASRTGDIVSFLGTVNRIAEKYFADIYNGDSAEVRARRVATDVPPAVRFFSIYDDTEYASGEHWELLTKFLGFEFDDIAFSFTESDCGNPALMAHLRGLKCAHIYGRSYAEGVLEYVEFAISLMLEKRFPEFLIEKIRARYASPEAIEHMREAMVQYSMDAFGVSDEQLLCMLYAPFGCKAAGLARYLAQAQPHLAHRAAEIRELLEDEELAADPGDRLASLRAAVERFSGLEIRHLRQLYASPVRRAESVGGGATTDVIGAILEGDPHKAIIKTRHSPAGPVVEELISGR